MACVLWTILCFSIIGVSSTKSVNHGAKRALDPLSSFFKRGLTEPGLKRQLDPLSDSFFKKRTLDPLDDGFFKKRGLDRLGGSFFKRGLDRLGGSFFKRGLDRLGGSFFKRGLDRLGGSFFKKRDLDPLVSDFIKKRAMYRLGGSFFRKRSAETPGDGVVKRSVNEGRRYSLDGIGSGLIGRREIEEALEHLILETVVENLVLDRIAGDHKKLEIKPTEHSEDKKTQTNKEN